MHRTSIWCRAINIKLIDRVSPKVFPYFKLLFNLKFYYPLKNKSINHLPKQKTNEFRILSKKTVLFSIFMKKKSAFSGIFYNIYFSFCTFYNIYSSYSVVIYNYMILRINRNNHGKQNKLTNLRLIPG